MAQREHSTPDRSPAGHPRRRRVVVALGAAAVVLVGVSVALLVPQETAPPGPPVPPGEPTYSEALLRARGAQTATLLADGRVLIIGGCATNGCTTAEGSPTTEYYIPGRGFTAGPELLEARQGHFATLLPDGRVLVAGGWAREGTDPLASAEIFDPEANRFEPAGKLNVPRGGASAIPLPGGRVFIAGGQTAGNDSTNTTEIFDPATGTFTPAAPMADARDAAVTAGLPDGRVLVVGGQDSHGKALASALLYDPKTDTWQSADSLSTPRNKAGLALLPDGRVLIMGGTPDGRNILDTTEIYDPRTGQFEPGPVMDTERFKITTTVDAAGRVIVVGGTQAAVYDSGRFRPLAGTSGPVRWSSTVTSLPDGDVLIVGGYDQRIQVHDDALLLSASQIAGGAG